MRSTRRWSFFCLLLPTAAAAYDSGAVSLNLNTSARAAGMGESGVATVWGGDTNVWANPALLAFRPGARYSTMHSQLSTGPTRDVFIDKKELTFSAYGVGLLYADDPIDHVFLDMGWLEGTDESGLSTGTFHSYMKSQSWGIGLSASEALHQLNLAEIGEYFDLAGGIVWKKFEDQLAANSVIQDAPSDGHGSASMRDFGWVARVTPLNTLARSASASGAHVGFLFAASYGRSKLNDTDEFIVHADIDQADPAPTTYLSGWALHAELQSGPRLMANIATIVRESLSPLLAITYTAQNSVPGYVWNGNNYVYERDKSGQYDTDGEGYEISLLNLFHLRRGHVSAPYGGIDGGTEGWGVCVQAGRYVGVRYDEATVPQAAGLPDVTREGWHFWVNVMELVERE